MRRIHVIQLVLVIASFFLMTVAGAEWRYAKSFLAGNFKIPQDLAGGLVYSISLMLFLVTHELGHYLLALKHKVKVTLPFFLPLWLGFLPGGFPSFGTMGAFIMIQGKAKSRKAYFDIGVAGPLAGFLVAIVIIIIGFMTLPPIQYIFDIHPEYLPLGENYGDYVPEGEGQVSSIFRFGQNLIFMAFENILPYDPANYPHQNEMIHYPLLMVGYIALFFTTLNLLPIGQLDGGHIIYGLFGKQKHAMISRVTFIAFLFYAGLGFIKPGRFDIGFFLSALAYIYFLYVCLFNVNTERMGRLMIAVIIFVGQFILLYLAPGVSGYPGLLLMAFITGRFIGIDHPSTDNEEPLDLKRKIIGWIAVIVFIISLSPKPFIWELKTAPEVDKTESTSHLNTSDTN